MSVFSPCREGGGAISVHTPFHSLYRAPKAPGVFLEQCLSLSLTTAAQKKKKTCHHWKLFSILMKQFFEDLWWLGALWTLSGKPFHPLWNELPLIHSYSSDETHSCLFLSFISPEFSQWFAVLFFHEKPNCFGWSCLWLIKLISIHNFWIWKWWLAYRWSFGRLIC